VTVQADAPLLRTETGDISHQIKANTMDLLPILGIGASQAGSAGIRNPYAATELIPGTMWQANSQVRVNGAPNNTQSFRIEGRMLRIRARRAFRRRRNRASMRSKNSPSRPAITRRNTDRWAAACST